MLSLRNILEPSRNVFNTFIQVRGAKKRAVGSRTNNKDSAGRRLGPKKHEGNFVKPGEIIMRQRGTKIHPGDNVKIGKDHTIYAVEPGYVRFYYDPFHPLRKYVGVALTNDIMLPKPHFEPRLRRFGYVRVSKALEAKEIEDSMSRKEELAQPRINQMKEATIEMENEFKSKFRNYLSKETKMNEKEVTEASERLYKIYQLLKSNMSLSEAREQCTFETLFNMKLNYKKGEYANEQEYNLSKNNYIQFSELLDSKIAVDFEGNLYNSINVKSLDKLKTEIKSELENLYTNEILKTGYKSKVENLIKTPGVFNEDEQTKLSYKYLPKVIPYHINGSITKINDLKQVPKGSNLKQIYDEKSKSANHYIIKTLG
ncbi:unnamed protein product [Candida verbasci]|uniref:Large ribosomal subunit protein bL27m n=1 Tax=Candida verbasci TaxID=1227364 RepID=A0A9W4TZQ1_9ASCO|nr:unnamed protein product [Candida verbasci]